MSKLKFMHVLRGVEFKLMRPRTHLTICIGLAALLAADGAAQSSGDPKSWGLNEYGQLGDRTLGIRADPTPVVGLGPTRAIAGGATHSVAIAADGTVWTWGSNRYGKLGTGTTDLWADRPGKVTGLSGWGMSGIVMAIAVGAEHTLALKYDGTLWAWGGNKYGQLGSGCAAASCSTPVQVPMDGRITAVAAGADHSMVLKGDGTVWAWGSNSHGQLGSNTPNVPSRSTPARIVQLDIASAIAAGGNHSMAIRPADATVWVWGSSADGESGVMGSNVHTPRPMLGLGGITSIAAGTSHSVALKSDGTVWTWGSNANTQLGDIDACRAGCWSRAQAGTVKELYETGNPFNSSYFRPIVVNKIDAGFDSTLASDANGTVWLAGNWIRHGCADRFGRFPGLLGTAVGRDHLLLRNNDMNLSAWGSNVLGQLGIGSVGSSVAPIPAIDVHDVVGVAAGHDHTLARRKDGTVWAWGRSHTVTNDSVGPVQVPYIDAAVAIAAGRGHSMALGGNGLLETWGRNEFGQLGRGHISYAEFYPYFVTNLTDVTAIAAGDNHCLAVKSDHTVWAWGDNRQGQLGTAAVTQSAVPLRVGSLNDIVAVAAGENHSLALTVDGRVWAWGGNSSGQLGLSGPNQYFPVMLPLSTVFAIAAGGSSSLALLTNGDVYEWGRYEVNGTEMIGSSARRVFINGPVQAIAAGAGHKLALGNDGRLWAWGDNEFGQLGDGTLTDHDNPVLVGFTADDRLVSIAAGGHHSVASVFIDRFPPSVTLQTPNGNEQLFTGTPFLIAWTASDDGGLDHFDVYSVPDGGMRLKTPICLGVLAEARSCWWNTPGPATTMGRIRVEAFDKTGKMAASTSGNTFTISNGAGYLYLGAAISRLEWVPGPAGVGTVLRIPWVSNLRPKAPIRVLLSRDGGATWAEISVVPNVGSFDWTVTGPTTIQARIRVEWTNGPVKATSGTFTIYHATLI